MSEELLNQLIKKLDDVILGRREIIFEIDKLKEQVFEIHKFTNSSTINQIVNIINEIKIYMQNSKDAVLKLNSNVKNLQNLINSFSNIIEKPFELTNSLKVDVVDKSITQSEISQKIPKVLKTFKDQNNSISHKTLNHHFSKPLLDKSLDNVEGSGFDLIISIAKSNNPALEIAKTLEKIRKRLENENPLNPILFELSMESRRLKALSNVPLDEYNLNILMEKIKKWIA